ncbi:MAG: tetratricopeptide repeat protein [Acidobacteriota bacterium]
MRKDNAIFFVCGIFFGALVGYFLFESVASTPARAPGAGEIVPSPGGGAPRRLIDPAEVSALERMARESPEDVGVRVRIGNLYMEGGDLARAERWLREALRIDQDNLHALNHLALVFVSDGRVDEAVAQYEAALEIDPSHPASLLGLGRIKLYAQQDIRGGLELWERLMRVAPESPEAQSIREELETLRSAHTGS